jgi:hypothetical protein
MIKVTASIKKIPAKNIKPVRTRALDGSKLTCGNEDSKVAFTDNLFNPLSVCTV